MIVGFDVGGTNARGLLIEPVSGQIVDRGRAPSAGTGPDLLDRLVTMVEELEQTNGVAVESVGLGVAGLAHRSGVIRYSPNLPELVEYPLGTELQARLDKPVTVINDATAAAWAEAKLGAGRGSDNFVFAALGTGIGTGFVSGGSLILGANGFAGEAGHMVVDAHGPSHITGQQGPWEYFASGSALGRMGREAAADGRFGAGIEQAGSVGEIVGQHVVSAVRSSDTEAANILNEFCREVARGLANLVVIFDPERIVIGGGLAEIGGPLREGTQRWLGKLLLGTEHRPVVKVLIAELGDDAGAIGAALIARDEI